MEKVECSKCGMTFEAKTEKKAKKIMQKHAKKYHSK